MLRRVWLLSLALLVVGCAPAVQVKTAFDPKVNFHAYKTFAMLQPNKPVHSENTDVDPFVLQRLRQFTYLGLRDMGFKPVTKAEADLLVGVIATKDERTQVYASRMYGHDPIYGPPSAAYHMQNIQEGVVAIDLIDRKRNAVIWRGTGVRSTSGRLSESQMKEVVDTILANYPQPGAGPQ